MTDGEVASMILAAVERLAADRECLYAGFVGMSNVVNAAVERLIELDDAEGLLRVRAVLSEQFDTDAVAA